MSNSHWSLNSVGEGSSSSGSSVDSSRSYTSVWYIKSTHYLYFIGLFSVCSILLLGSFFPASIPLAAHTGLVPSLAAVNIQYTNLGKSSQTLEFGLQYPNLTSLWNMYGNKQAHLFQNTKKLNPSFFIWPKLSGSISQKLLSVTTALLLSVHTNAGLVLLDPLFHTNITLAYLENVDKEIFPLQALHDVFEALPMIPLHNTKNYGNSFCHVDLTSTAPSLPEQKYYSLSPKTQRIAEAPLPPNLLYSHVHPGFTTINTQFPGVLLHKNMDDHFYVANPVNVQTLPWDAVLYAHSGQFQKFLLNLIAKEEDVFGNLQYSVLRQHKKTAEVHDLVQNMPVLPVTGDNVATLRLLAQGQLQLVCATYTKEIESHISIIFQAQNKVSCMKESCLNIIPFTTAPEDVAAPRSVTV